MTSQHLRGIVGAVAAAALLMTSCVASANPPADCSAATITRSATLTGEALSPQHIDACKGQKMTLELDVKEDGELHFHGYDDQVPETPVQAGTPSTFSFEMTHVGQFPIELHLPVTGEEVQVGILTVYER